MDSIYLFTGANQYQIERDIERIIEASKADELSLSKYDCSEVLVDEAVYDCETLSFFEHPKVIIVNHPVFLTSERSKLEHNLDLLTSYLNNPNEENILIINAMGLKVDKRKAITKLLMKVANVKNYDALSEQDARFIIERELHVQNKKINHDALNEFVTRTECDALKIYSELEKISFYLNDKETITIQDIQSLIALPLEQNIFNLTNHIIAGNIEEALIAFYRLKQQNEEPIVFSAVLARNFHLMYMIKIYQSQRIPERQIQSLLNIHPFQLKKLYQITLKTSLKAITENIERLAMYDIDVKTGKVEKYLGFEMFILKQHSKTYGVS